jgi:DNA-binding winged helix-turn-helix (wHTH) protein/Tfp pilus assembly protein PilF
MHSARQLSSVIRFGVFEADVSSGELRKSGAKVRIQDLPFRALSLLLNHPNEVLSRDQFRRALWPEGVFVDFDHGISSAINRLRDALGDSADNPVFIETVERRGYRWIAPTHIAPTHLAPIEILSSQITPAQIPVTPIQPTQITEAPTIPGRPVLVRMELPKALADAPRTQGWRWSLVLSATALVLMVWSFWPNHRAARAGTTKLPTVTQPSWFPSHPSVNSEAQQFYLKGRFYWEKRTPDGLNKAVDYFTQAIVHDPNYAPAYVGLADCYNLLREYTLMPASEAYPRALAAAKRAVELDDQSSEAHASLAFALFYGTWDAAAAEQEFRRALDLNPNNAVAHHWYATYLATVGRSTEAMSEIERAQTLDPASKSVLADKGRLLWSSGSHDEGAALLKQLEATEPEFVSPHRYLRDIYYAAGDYTRFLDEWKKEEVLLQDRSGLKLVDTAEKGFAATGATGMLRNMLAMQQKLYERGLESPYFLAQTTALLGNKQEALQYLKVAYDKHDDSVVQMKNDPAFISLQDDPDYQELIARLGFPAK